MGLGYWEANVVKLFVKYGNDNKQCTKYLPPGLLTILQHSSKSNKLKKKKRLTTTVAVLLNWLPLHLDSVH